MAEHADDKRSTKLSKAQRDKKRREEQQRKKARELANKNRRKS